MTEITHPRGAEETQAAGGDGLIAIELVGCPNSVPRMMVSRKVMAEGKVKIPFGNGYDHFEFDSYATRDGQPVPVFAWTDRTRIAE